MTLPECIQLLMKQKNNNIILVYLETFSIVN